MEDELYHAKGHKYLKKILGKNGIVRYIYKLSSERAANNYMKEQKKAQAAYNSALNDYRRYANRAAELEKKEKEVEKQADRAFDNGNFDEWGKKWDEYEDLFEQSGEARAEALFAKAEVDYQAKLIKMYYEAGKAARQSYLDFVEDSESLLKQVKGKSFTSNLFSKIFKKKK